MNFLRWFKAFIPHLSIAMLLGLLVIIYVDGRNPLMAFLTSGASKTYMCIMCLAGIVTAAILIAEMRKNGR